MRTEEEVREMIGRIDERIKEDPVFDDFFAARKDNPLHQAKLALKWVLGEKELRKDTVGPLEEEELEG